MYFFFSSRRRHTRFDCDWSSDVCSSDLLLPKGLAERRHSRIRAGHQATKGSFPRRRPDRSEEHTSELQSQSNLVCRLLLEKKKTSRPSASESATGSRRGTQRASVRGQRC